MVEVMTKFSWSERGEKAYKKMVLYFVGKTVYRIGKNFLHVDWKKMAMKKRIIIVKEKVYRQDYCGCKLWPKTVK